MTREQVAKYAFGDLVINLLVGAMVSWHTKWWIGLLVFAFFNEFSLISRSLMAIAEKNLDNQTVVTTASRPYWGSKHSNPEAQA